MKCIRLRGSSKRNHRNIALFATLADFFEHFIFFGNIVFIIAFVCKNICNRLHKDTFSRRVCFINQNGEFLCFQIAKKIIVQNVVELVNRCNDNFCVAAKGDSQVFRGAFIVHNFDLTALVFNTQDSFLQLTVNDDTVGNNQNGIKDILVS